MQNVLSDGFNEVMWNKALKFIGNEIKGNGLIRKLKTPERGELRKHEDIAEYFNKKFTLETHDPKKLQVPLVHRLDEVNAKSIFVTDKLMFMAYFLGHGV
jgi:hypothetical protein